MQTLIGLAATLVLSFIDPNDPLPPGDQPGETSWCFLPKDGLTNCGGALVTAEQVGCDRLFGNAAREECFGAVLAQYNSGNFEIVRELLEYAATCDPTDPTGLGDYCIDALDDCQNGTGPAACGLHLNDSPESCVNDALQEVPADTGFVTAACSRMFYYYDY